MTFTTTPELEAQLVKIARASGRDLNTVHDEAIQQYVEHYIWFADEAAKGFASLDRGEGIADEEILKHIERRFPA